METFACGYCGTSQHVVRSGGTVSLHLGEAIAKVQRGTDRTASELAVRRLKEDLAEIENKIRRYHDTINASASGVPAVLGFVGIGCIIALLGFAGGSVAIGLIFLIGSGAVAFFSFRGIWATRARNEQAMNALQQRAYGVRKRIDAELKVLNA